MTSNIGSLHLLDGHRRTTARSREDARGRVMARPARRTSGPEFLNRVDEIVLFKPLTLEEIEQIVDLQIDDVRAAPRRPAPRRSSSPSRRAC